MYTARHHTEWLSLIEVSGPFLSLPVLLRVFPQGLDAHDPDLFRDLRAAYEEWEDSQSRRGADRSVQRHWIRFVLGSVLDLPEEVLAEAQAIPQTLKATVAEHGETLRPDTVVVNPRGGTDPGKPRLLIQTYPRGQSLDSPVAERHWKASPSTRMMELLHATDTRLGLVTNGEQWMLVGAPRGETTGFASWYANLWLDEQVTLRAFRSLLSVRRFFAVPDSETLEAMLAESAENQQEVTEQLGYQVRRAVEVLVQHLDQADQDHGRELLADVSETVLYEAALTVMMRLVFLFCAEERELLLLGDPLYDQHYAVSTLREQLRDAADQHGEEVLERRLDAWCRLLATFRAVFAGVQHDRMRLLAYGGRLFDPDRFPFLEGRQTGTSWRTHAANPLPVNNRTVLHLLESLQLLEVKLPGGGPPETQRLSFRALDIEQIGHVYEGLLDHTAKRADEPILGLQGARDKEPEIALSELEAQLQRGENECVEYLRERTGRSGSALRKALQPDLETPSHSRLQAACGNDPELCRRVQPFAGLIRTDTFGYPVVIPAGSVYVTAGTDRRSSGTHYTPRSLTEPIVQYTLEPLVYVGPAEGKPKEEWQLRPAAELLDLRICDMACGSGAFLVQACRYMSERLLEAWEDAERQHPGVPGITPLGEAADGSATEQIIPKDPDERLAFARRLVAQRCLYGVDINPLAVEMAKLSLWLLTLAKDKPFTFLDHAIRPGDSLVGIRDLRQLEVFNLDGQGESNPLFLRFLRGRIERAVELRRRIEERPADRPEDVEAQAELMRQAEEQLGRLKWAADMLVAADFQGNTAKEREQALFENSVLVAQHFDETDTDFLRRKAEAALGGRRTLHWPLEFPEIVIEQGGFDAFVCNPPYMGGPKITTNLTTPYRDYLVARIAGGHKGSADLCAYFLLRASSLLRQAGLLGFITTDIVGQGDTRQVGLQRLVNGGCGIPRAVSSSPWPGQASVRYALVWLCRGRWEGQAVLDGSDVVAVTPLLTAEGGTAGTPFRLMANQDISFIGSYVLGMGFTMSPEEGNALVVADPRSAEVLFPYIVGQEINAHPEHASTRTIINFRDWPLSRELAPPGYSGPVASDYPDCLAIIEAKVKPDREKLNRETRRRYWWRYGDRAPALYAQISGLQAVWAIATAATKYVEFARLPSDMVYSHSVTVIASDSLALFAAITSSFHKAWARNWASYNLSLLRYTPSDCLETFPLPSDVQRLEPTGQAYFGLRKSIMLGRWEGLTSVYNRFHDPREAEEDIGRLRELHVEMDHAVAAAYGWTDLELGHGFHETKQGLRYTISDPARREVLSRLLQLNHDRYAEEVARGLHEKRTGKAKAAGRKAKTSGGRNLFE